MSELAEQCAIYAMEIMRLTAERDAANRALFQAQEAAKKLLSERDALLVRLERAQQGWAAD